ncbi:protein MAINTENANCE OF MERISTEMS-like [Vicia villosa]|uniref:protein MAINTENANCE OF MERISTEMS-like n=1 Tax=Vicia villosa TaxID=3911 RepID=UPI00273C7180|nr:protein MAINTENANCE OF MERISTEMS-like [Vicia villosa]
MLVHACGRRCDLCGQECEVRRRDLPPLLHGLDHRSPVELGAATLAYLYQKLNEASNWRTRQLTGSCTLLTSWIISYFSRIHGFHIDPEYVDAMPRAARYVLQRGNNAVGPYRGYLDRTMHDDVTWRPFSDYTQVVPFDGISLYSGWLACGTSIMVRYLPERCMRQFGFVQMIPRSPFEAAPDTVTRVQFTAIFEDWEHHVVPEEYRRIRVT